MKRRDFLKGAAVSAASLGLGLGGFGFGRAARAAAMDIPNTLVNVLLIGGADYRYLFAPAPGTEYAAHYWNARRGLYQSGADSFTEYAGVWSELYQETQYEGQRFGIHKSAAWLKQQFEAGNVAIVCNVAGPVNRRHDHAKLIWQAGDAATGQFNFERDGWGGRLAAVLGDANTVAVSKDVPLFCQGSDPSNRLAQLIHAHDSRNFSLAEGHGADVSPYRMTARALQSYYASLRQNSSSQGADWPYRRFLNHEQQLRRFGSRLTQRLAAVAPEQPATLQQLYDRSGALLRRADFGQQCASLYDCVLAADIFNMRVAYMDYDGWDTHRVQRPRIESNLTDIFGADRGLDRLTQALDAQGNINDNLVYVFTTDFGRQLGANGDAGTDHGSANYMLLVGRAVRGGIYGAMFPHSEIDERDGTPRYQRRGADIEGLTSFERVLSQACDWVAPGAGAQVFPNAQSAGAKIESGVDLSRLFT